MNELSESRRIEAEKRLRELVREAGDIRGAGDMDPAQLGNYLLEQVEEDHGINNVKRDIIGKNDFYKRKQILLDLEYLAIILTKKPEYYDME